MSCKLPSGKIPELMISLTISAVRNEVYSDGFTTAATPAMKFTAIFSNIPQIGKLNALI